MAFGLKHALDRRRGRPDDWHRHEPQSSCPGSSLSFATSILPGRSLTIPIPASHHILPWVYPSLVPCVKCSPPLNASPFRLPRPMNADLPRATNATRLNATSAWLRLTLDRQGRDPRELWRLAAPRPPRTPERQVGQFAAEGKRNERDLHPNEPPFSLPPTTNGQVTHRTAEEMSE